MDDAARLIGEFLGPGATAAFAEADRQPESWARRVQVVAEHAARRMGTSVSRRAILGGQIASALRHSGRAILGIANGSGLIAIMRCSGRRVQLLSPAGLVEVPLPQLVEDLLRSMWPEDATRIEALPGVRRSSDRAALRNAWRCHSLACFAWVWADRSPHLSLLPTFTSALVARFAAVGAVAASWWVIGPRALSGHVDQAWAVFWFMLVASAAVLHTVSGIHMTQLLARGGGYLRRRLFGSLTRAASTAALRLGTGTMLSRAFDMALLEEQLPQVAILLVFAVIEFAVAVLLSVQSAAPALLIAGLGISAVIFVALALHLNARMEQWIEARQRLTSQAIEDIAGFRTRLIQGDPTWHAREDARLRESYQNASASLDDAVRRIGVLSERGWLTLGFVLLGPSIVSGTTASSALVGISAILVGARATRNLGAALIAGTQLVAVAKRLRALFVNAEAHSDSLQRGDIPPSDDQSLAFHDVTVDHPGARRPLLTDLHIKAESGSSVLVTGASGSGKSTLCSVIGGWRPPTTGLVLLGGLDQATLGAEVWRSRVTVAPQFSTNHLFSESLAFNLLLGRVWPPVPSDLKEATAVCEELGLGPLLRRMPAGIFQPVGEDGWQLSHGERSRVFIARALLQRPEWLLLDESLAALDPVLLNSVIRAIRDRTSGLIVVAHP